MTTLNCIIALMEWSKIRSLDVWQQKSIFRTMIISEVDRMSYSCKRLQILGVPFSGAPYMQNGLINQDTMLCRQKL